MAKRMFLMLGVTAVLLTALGFIKFKQVQSAVQAATFQPPPEAVTSVVVKREVWPSTTGVIGTMEAVRGVMVSADLPGSVARINFDSGKSVRAGDILVELDTRQERAQLAALEAQRDLAKVNFARMEQLVKQGVISRMEYDQATAQQRQTEANVGEIRATIERKTIRAPFSGTLGIRKVNLGQYLSAGSAVVQLQALNPIYVNFGLPQQALGQVRVGRNLRVTSGRSRGQGVHRHGSRPLIRWWTRLRGTFRCRRPWPIRRASCSPACSYRWKWRWAQAGPWSPLPASAINYAPYGDSVYVITDLKDPKGQTYRGVRQQFVKVEGSRGDQVGIVSGLNPGDEVVTSGVFKLRNGAAVQVNNKVQPGNNPAPKPEES